MSAERLQALAAFLPEFEKPDFTAGSWTQPKHVGGFVELGYVRYSEVVRAFEQMAYDNEWVLTDFDWSDWSGTDEAMHLRRDAGAMEDATAEQLAQVLTFVIRGDRFCEGALLGAFESGLIQRITRRAAALLAASSAGP